MTVRELKRSQSAPEMAVVAPPPLENGDRLTRWEFERRYEAMPDNRKAELIEGVVYMASPVSMIHARPHSHILAWLGVYCGATPGVDIADNVTVRLDAENEVQPDALLRMERSGHSAVGADSYVQGSPELIVEIAVSSAAYDLHDKLKVYRRNGVQEYIVWQVYDKRVDWFELQDGEYLPLARDEESGAHKSKVFPGLYLSAKALLEGDLAGVLAELQKGLASPEHEQFARRLKEKQA